MALTLFGVTFIESHDVRPPVPDTELIVVRDVAAVCGQSPYSRPEPTPERISHFASVIDSYSQRGPVLPAPMGVVFRSRDAVQRWLELHFVSLSDALNYVENRVVARVHVWRPGEPDEREVGADLAATAADSLRALRHSSVTTVPLRLEKLTGIVLSAAYLVEVERWNEFTAQVEALGRESSALRFELTGPWPPYDFVQMQIGS
ncbi:MAG TPA: GvpL/GvpF family gas vesicle protein [Gemmatimonadaceae bacterium]|nr:GvpL/GvpF family gas vesicle protein [Gemmatimonadaceae bacterium]